MTSAATCERRAWAFTGPGTRLRGGLDPVGYESRPGQLAMAERIAARHRRRRAACSSRPAQARARRSPTWCPRCSRAARSSVSTGTQDAPGSDRHGRPAAPRRSCSIGARASSSAPWRRSWARHEGLANYVCLRPARRGATDQGTLSPTPSSDQRVAGSPRRATRRPRRPRRPARRRAGCGARCSATPETRIGARCAYFERCFVTRMRRARRGRAARRSSTTTCSSPTSRCAARWPEARRCLPPYEVVIFDEAHQIEDVATEFFGVHVSTQRLFALGRDPARARGERVATLAGRVGGGAPERRCRGAGRRAARPRVARAAPGRRRGARCRSPDDAAAGTCARARYHGLDGVLEEIAAWLDRRRATAVARVAAPGRSSRRSAAGAAALRTDLGCSSTAAARREHVRWLAATPPQRERCTPRPSTSAPRSRALRRLRRARSCSRRRRSRSPARSTSSASASAWATPRPRPRYASPFRYARQALLYVATDLPEPNARRLPAGGRHAHGRARAPSRAAARCCCSRASATCASPRRTCAPRRRSSAARAGRDARATCCSPSCATRIGSVLLATQSFWEGVDVPGEALSLVVMDKIPFARARRSADGRAHRPPARSGRRALRSIPAAARRARAQAGLRPPHPQPRRLRHRRRSSTGACPHRSYGAKLVASLPPDCPRTESLEDVAAFWARGPVAAAAAARAELAAATERRRHGP